MHNARRRGFALPAFIAVFIAASTLAGPAATARPDSAPNEPVDLGINGWGPNGADATPCLAGDDRPFIGTRTPRLRARLSDADQELLRADFTVRTADGTKVAELAATSVPSGSYAEVTVPQDVLAENGLYTWSVHASDGKHRSKSVGDCEFQVDTVHPNAPVVSSADYPPGGFHGSPGRTGIFTFSPNGSTDVVRYSWSLTGGARGEVETGGVVNVPITPTSSGPNSLTVRAFDKAGNSATQSYGFMVGDLSRQVAVWNLDETTGTTAADATGNGHTLTLDGASFGSGYSTNGLVNTTSSFSSTSSAVVDTSRAFSVSAWVKLDNTESSYTVASQDGDQESGFSLQYNKDVDRWRFGAATSTTVPQAGEWTHLLATYDSNKLSLYVNGKLEGTANATLSNASGPFVVGAGKSGGARVGQLQGTIDHVQVWDRALSAAEAAKHSNLVVLRAHYNLDELAGTTTKDEISGQNGTLSGDVTWRHTPIDPDDPNQILTSKDKWLRFNSGAMTGPRPANLRTDRSFTVSAWVRPNGAGDTALSLGDAATSPFVVGHHPETNRWSFLLRENPSSAGIRVLSDHAAHEHNWAHLVATFDAVTGTIKFYVDGIQQAATSTGLRSFDGVGDFAVGSGWTGDIDDARIHSGMIGAWDVVDLYSETKHF